MKESKSKGYILGIIAAASYGMNPVFAMPLFNDGMDAVSVLFFRYILALPAVWLLMRMRGRYAAVGMQRIVPLCLLGIAMVISSITLFRSYLYMDVGIASTLLFVYPLMVALIMVGFYHEIMSLRTFLCLIGAIGGVWLLCSNPDGSGSVSLPGLILVLVSSLSYAIYIVGINRPPVRSVATLTITFWVLLSGSFVLGIIVLARGWIATPQTWWMWGNILMLAIVPTIISFLCTNAAIEKIGSTAAAALGAFEPVTAVVFGILIFGEQLTLRTTLGLVIILVCVTLVITSANITRQILAIRKLFPKAHRHPRHHRHRK